jgi:hypothetical protein
MTMTTTSEQCGDVTVNLAGMWMLQAMCDIATVAPELATVPYGAPRTGEWLAADPRIDELQAAGLLGADRQPLPAVAQRMAVLGAPDVEVLALIARGPLRWAPPIDVTDPATWVRDIPEDQLHIVLARRDDHWVSAVRAGDQITIDDVHRGDGPCAPWVRDLLLGQLDALHPVGPSRMAAMNLPHDDVLAAVKVRAAATAGSPQRDLALAPLGIPPAAVAEFRALLDEPVVEACLYARAYVDARPVAGTSPLNLGDTPAGRVALYRMVPARGSTQDWMSIAPATPVQVLAGVRTVLGSVGVRDFDKHRRLR